MAYYSKDSQGNPRKGRNLDELLDKIQEAKIESGTITIGGDSITPITEHQDISGKANVGDSYTKQESDAKYSTKQELANKQDALVSGTNIKTINSQSILGSGNIEIQSSTQVNSDWNATSGVAEILNKPTIPTVPTNISAFNNDAGYLTQHQSLNGYATEQWVGQQGYLTQHQDITGKEDAANKKTTITGNESSTTYYPTTKAVADYVSGIVGDINTILDQINGEAI